MKQADKSPDGRTLEHADEEAAYLAAAVGALGDRHAAAKPHDDGSRDEE